MCVEGWKRKRWNPAGVKITTVEVRVLIYRSEFCFADTLRHIDSYPINQR